MDSEWGWTWRDFVFLRAGTEGNNIPAGKQARQGKPALRCVVRFRGGSERMENADEFRIAKSRPKCNLATL
jgi:hypothetical protein